MIWSTEYVMARANGSLSNTAEVVRIVNAIASFFGPEHSLTQSAKLLLAEISRLEERRAIIAKSSNPRKNFFLENIDTQILALLKDEEQLWQRAISGACHFARDSKSGIIELETLEQREALKVKIDERLKRLSRE